jgi:hypothetical protein
VAHGNMVFCVKVVFGRLYEHLLYDDGYARFYMVRYPPQNVPMAVTRKEVLRVLKTFFMSTQAMNYPPGSSEIVDITTEDPAVMEKIFLGKDIEESLKALLDIEELNDEFYYKYTEFAETICHKKEPSDYAKSILGFPSLHAE